MHLKDIIKKKLDFDLKSVRNRNSKKNNNNNYMSQELYTSSQNVLPKLNFLNVTNRISMENNLLSQRIKIKNKIDKYLLLPNYKFNIFNKEKDDLYNIIPLKIKNKRENPKLNHEVYPNKKYEYSKSVFSKININYSPNREKMIRKYKNNSTKNIVIKGIKIVKNYNKEKNNDNTSKKENKNQNIKNLEKYKIKNIKSNSMFMTQINFINKEENIKENKTIEKNVINKEDKITENKIDYDSLNLKELIKHLRNNRKKIIKNQNDINNMIKTTRDTYNEIWNLNHH